ncbi:MAG: hypothetical protein IPK10_11620 [Bacteroidetes bacterium]|nr:hypothetical protein [Bacteroidota bacterium]
MMEFSKSIKITSLSSLYELMPKQEREMLDVLRQIILDVLPKRCKEKFPTMFHISMAIKEYVLFGQQQSHVVE